MNKGNQSIVVLKDFKLFPDQVERLNLLGEVKYYKNPPKTNEEWLDRCKDADIICSPTFGLNSDKVYELENVFISVPFVGVEFIDLKKLKKRNIILANSPGCNKEAVVEWILGILLMSFRRLDKLSRVKGLEKDEILKTGLSLFDKKIIILGYGHIGKYLGKICKSFGMHVTFFKRGDDLIKKSKDADIVANCLSVTTSSKGLLNRKFFKSLKKDSFFISSSKSQIYDIDALIETLDAGILIGAADDVASADIGDATDEIYLKLLKHPKISVTPHIAWNSDTARRKSNDIMIGNIEAWINQKPINLVTS